MRSNDVSGLAGISVSQVYPATVEEVRRAYSGRVATEILDLIAQIPACFWKAGNRYFLDDPYFGNVVAIDDLDYNREVGLHVRETKISEDNQNISDKSLAGSNIILGKANLYRSEIPSRITAIGDEYLPNKTHWNEGNFYCYSQGSHNLLLACNNPTKREIEGVDSGEIDIRLYTEKNVVLLVFRFTPGFPWQDAPYSWYLVPEPSRTYPHLLSGNIETILNIDLIDACTGILKAQRIARLGHGFSNSLHQAILDQINMPDSRSQYDANLDLIYRKFSSADLAQRSKAKVAIPGFQRKSEDG